MLTYLSIDNLALIEHAEVEFGPGFNVVTGETGAGKSVLLGAVLLLLGGRADRNAIRAGAERCEICGIFQLPPDAAAEVAIPLAEADIPFDPETGELQLRRILTRETGRCHINGTAVPARLLQTIGELVIDVHTANEHQSLTDRGKQLEILDRFANSAPLRAECARICAAIRQLQSELEEFEKNMPSPAEAEYLASMTAEIDRVAPQPGEDTELAARHTLAAHAREAVENAARIAGLLADAEDSVSDRIAETYRLLQELAQLDQNRSADFLERCSLISEMVRELARDVADFGGSAELDEAAFQELEQRLGDLYTLKRRYGQTLEQVIEEGHRAADRLAAFHRSRERRQEFTDQLAARQEELRTAAGDLTRCRQQAADAFARAIEAKLQHLGFPGGRLTAELTAVEPGPNGADRLELLFSANPGEPPLPLRKIASSGELSRLMLACKTVLSDADRIPVAIFDEIDVNIGGETAVQVGRELKALGRRRQLLAISHLAQVAANGDRHFRVEKTARDDGRTVTGITPLTPDGRRTELARMLGGGTAAMAHAATLLEP
ncbi:MAG: DNA repair protein RecN [Lentisphaeria bacterium]|nr:DNA repair protein RecN [Lentisphaeria bacterium]